MCIYIYTYVCIYICIYRYRWRRDHRAGWPGGARSRVATVSGYTYAGLVSNPAPTWSSGCCFTACRFYFGKSSGRSAIRIEPN